jgi:hypothetical protein
MVDFEGHDFSGREIHFEYVSDGAPRELARLALEGFYLLATDFFEPLSVDLWLTCVEAESGYPVNSPKPDRPFWLLKRTDLPPDVSIQPAWEDEEVAETERLTPDSILDWMTGAAEQNSSAGVIAWRQLLFCAARVRLPRSPGGGMEEGKWIVGPLKDSSFPAPLEVMLTNEAGLLAIELSLYWSPWTDSYGDGKRTVDEAVERLLARGWTQL